MDVKETLLSVIEVQRNTQKGFRKIMNTLYVLIGLLILSVAIFFHSQRNYAEIQKRYEKNQAIAIQSLNDAKLSADSTAKNILHIKHDLLKRDSINLENTKIIARQLKIQQNKTERKLKESNKEINNKIDGLKKPIIIHRESAVPAPKKSIWDRIF